MNDTKYVVSYSPDILGNTRRDPFRPNVVVIDILKVVLYDL